MQVKHMNPSDTEAVLSVNASQAELSEIKKAVLTRLSANVKVTGFRPGKAPLEIVEKNVDQSVLQSEFIDEALNQMYFQALRSEKLRPVANPKIDVKKFVPFTTLEFEATIPVVGKVTVGNYKSISVPKPKVAVTTSDVTEVLQSLQKRMAEKQDVDRAAKDKDQVWIDFSGVNAKGEAIKGADGKDYPLVLGGNTFIPGFEKNLVGLKAGEETTFTLTFPKDYGVKALASKKVTFTVTVNKVQEVKEPKLDDSFAAKAGPFKTLQELKDDIKRQMTLEREQQARQEFESNLVREITKKSKVAIPKLLIDEQVDRMIAELKQNLVYRGQTFPEYLESLNMTEEEFRSGDIARDAEERVKASLVLTEISELEDLTITNKEIDERISTLKSQYQDTAMRAELDKPENRNDIASRILTEKTIATIVGYASN